MAEEKINMEENIDEIIKEVKEETAAEAEKTAETEDAAPETEKAPAEEKKPEENRKGFKKNKKEGKAPKTQEEKPAEPEGAVSKDTYLRLMAEYDNFRKRSQKEKDDLYPIIKSDTVSKFLPVYDNLERALSAETADEAYRKGVELIMSQFKQTLEKLGVTEIDCLGKTFDPQLENAVMHVDDEEKGENEVVEVFQKGFMLGEKVIRFAMVKVAN